jgi:hypothetical protein
MQQLTLFRSSPPKPFDRLDVVAAESERLLPAIDDVPTSLQLRMAEALTAEVEAVCDEMERVKCKP